MQSHYIKMAETEKVQNWVNVNLANYLKKEKNEEDGTEIEHIIDYLNSSKCPNRIKFMSYDEAKSNSDKWMKTLIKKAGNIVETEADVETYLDFEDGMKFVQLIGKPAFEREGHLMSHCVSSYHGKSDMKIYSLRDSSNNPHCTIEVQENNGYINQIKGKGNGSIHPKYINYVLQILKKLGQNVRGSELSNLGYEELSDETWAFLEQDFTGVKYIMFNNNKYFYVNSKMEKKVS